MQEEPPAGAGPISQAKRLCLETPVVVNGEPQAVVLVPPGDPAIRSIAERLVAQVAQATTAHLRVEEAGPPEGYRSSPAQNVIALGCFADNGLLRTLYYQFYTLVDRWYPGPGGYALHTVHDPWGTGRNVIVVGGSDVEGVRAAAEALAPQLAPGRSWVLPRLWDVHPGPGLVQLSQERPATVGGRSRRPWPQLPTDWRYGLDRSDLACAAIEYLWTGNEEAAQAYRRAILALGAGGSHLFYLANPVLWDLMEEAPVFTEEERLRVTNGMLGFFRSPEGVAEPFYHNAIGVRAPRQNHQTRLAVAVYFGATYFSKYYGLPEARRWLADVERFWEPQLHSSKPMCDSNGHQWAATLENAATYALASGHLEFFTEGHARAAAERALVLMRPSGGMSSLGDSGVGDGANGLLTKAAHFYGDGRYLYPGLHLPHPAADDEICRPFADGTEPVEPGDQLGVRSVPVDPLYYHWWDTDPGSRNILHPPDVPLNRCFDKLAFRSSWDPSSEYLILDGISGGSHSYDDANSIAEVGVGERSFVVTFDSVNGPRYIDHNTLNIVRDGQGTRPPGFAACEAFVDRPGFGFSQTTVRNYADATARRSILWRKGSWFLVVDDAEAQAPGTYTLRCNWRCLGRPTLGRDGLQLSQDDAAGKPLVFRIVPDADYRHSLEPGSEQAARTVSEYPFAEPVLWQYRQTQVCALQTGEHALFVNLLGWGARRYKLERVGERSWRLSDGSDDVLVMLGDGGVSLGALRWSGSFAAIGADRMLLVDGRRLEYAGKRLVDSQTSVSLAWDLKRGVADAGGEPYALRVPAGLREALRAAVREEERVARSPGRQTSVQKLTPLWRTAVGSPVLDLTTADVTGEGTNAVVYGTQGRQLGVLSPEGSELWRRELRGAIHSVDACDLDGDGRAEVVAGNDDDRVCTYDAELATRFLGYRSSADDRGGGQARPPVPVSTDESRVSAFSSSGNLLWETAIPFGNPIWPWWTLHSSSVRKVLATDADGDGKAEVYAGCGNMNLYRLDAAGNLGWSLRIDHGVITRLLAADANGDGKPVLLGGCYPMCDHSGCFVVDPASGKQVTICWNEGWISALSSLAVADVDGDGKPETLAGTNKGNLYLRRLPSRDVVWQRSFGDTVTALGFVPTDGSGRDIVLTTAAGYVVRLNANGETAFSTGLPDEALCLVVTSSKGQTRLVVGDRDGGAYVLGGEGRVLGRLQTSGPVQCAKVIAPGLVAVGSDDGHVYGLAP